MLGAKWLSRIIQTGMRTHSNIVNIEHSKQALKQCGLGDNEPSVISSWHAGFKTQQSSRKERHYGSSTMQKRLYEVLGDGACPRWTGAHHVSAGCTHAALPRTPPQA